MVMGLFTFGGVMEGNNGPVLSHGILFIYLPLSFFFFYKIAQDTYDYGHCLLHTCVYARKCVITLKSSV